MINPNAKLNPKLFALDVGQVPIRNGYGEGLLLAGENNPRVVALCADLTESTRTEAFAKKFPERFVEIGVAEQNLATVAAGMSLMGKIPYISSYAMFSPGRNWEQIRTTIAYNGANVKIAGAHAGISVGPDGATHQALEDIAIMRAMPTMMVFAPCDAIEAKKLTFAVSQIEGAVYMRFAREKTPLITTDKTPFQIGKAQVFWEGENPQVAIVACGPLVYEALVAAAELKKKKIDVVVINSPTIKPLDEGLLLQWAKYTGAVVTVEEHQVTGGLGGAVAEYLSKNHPVPIEMIGVEDRFGESGTPDELLKKFGLKSKNIIEAVRDVMERKHHV